MYHLFNFLRLIRNSYTMSYKNLEVWKLANEVVIEIHFMTLRDLPKFEMYEVGSQIRRSSKSIKSNIVEGYGRKNYQLDFAHFLVFALGSTLETADHLETLFLTKSLTDEKKYRKLADQLDKIGRMLNLFIQKARSNVARNSKE
jgi:four helix bundle protein